MSADSTTASYHAGSDYVSDNDIILYAVWTPWTHTVVFDANGGIGDLPDSFTVTTGEDNVIIPDCSLTRKNHVFKYWSTQSSGSGGKNYYNGDGYDGLKNGGTIILYAIWDITTIYLYANGECRAGEFIEDDYPRFSDDGTVHYFQFVESLIGNIVNLVDESDNHLTDEFGNNLITYTYAPRQLIGLSPDGFYAKEFLERVVVRLTDESDVYLIDESGNYLTTIL